MKPAEQFEAEQHDGARDTTAAVGLRNRRAAALAEHAHHRAAAAHGCGFCWERLQALNATGPQPAREFR